MPKTKIDRDVSRQQPKVVEFRSAPEPTSAPEMVSHIRRMLAVRRVADDIIHEQFEEYLKELEELFQTHASPKKGA